MQDYLARIKAKAALKGQPVKVAQDGKPGAYLRAIKARAAQQEPKKKGNPQLRCQLDLNP